MKVQRKWAIALIYIALLILSPLLILFLIEKTSGVILDYFPNLTLDGQELNKVAWDSTFQERKLPAPPHGPRDGWEGKGLGPTKPDPDLQYTLTSPVRIGKYVDVNEEGFQIVGDPRTAQYRILILGGSVGFGAYASDIQHTYFSRMLDYLKSQNQSVVIYVLATHGWRTRNELAALEKYGLAIKPNLVLFVDALNDLSMQGDLVRWPSYPKPRNILPSFIYNSDTNVLAYVLKVHRTDFKNQRPYKEAYLQRPVEAYLENMQRAKLLGQKNGFQVAYLLQPFILEKTHLSYLEKKILNGHNSPGLYPEMISSFQKLRKGLVAVSDDKTTFFHDCSAVFADIKETTFTDLWHFTDPGHEVFAQCASAAVLQVREKIIPSLSKI
jgi:hypothetical protein